MPHPCTGGTEAWEIMIRTAEKGACYVWRTLLGSATLTLVHWVETCDLSSLRDSVEDGILCEMTHVHHQILVYVLV